ncbi:hypothetical protein EDC01DRAFT_663031 [Geopyxis carbonaria]|nr:hypothetical protein EDC01DRAFT_663031 [Geopyxis carbonaria]
MCLELLEILPEDCPLPSITLSEQRFLDPMPSQSRKNTQDLNELEPSLHTLLRAMDRVLYSNDWWSRHKRLFESFHFGVHFWRVAGSNTNAKLANARAKLLETVSDVSTECYMEVIKNWKTIWIVAVDIERVIIGEEPSNPDMFREYVLSSTPKRLKLS